MLQIGCNLSSSKGFLHMGKEALSIHATTFQFFTRNPRGSKVKALDIDDINALLKLMDEHEIKHVVAHAPYTLNPCSATERTREFALETMQDDLMRLDYLPNQFYNFPPGSNVGQGVEEGIRQIIEVLNIILKPEQKTTAVSYTHLDVYKRQLLHWPIEYYKYVVDFHEIFLLPCVPDICPEHIF